MDTISLEKSHLFTMQQDVRQIAQPLFDHSDITAFSLMRKYKNNTMTVLSTIPDFVSVRLLQNTLKSYDQSKKFLQQLNQPQNKLDGALFYFFKDYNPAAYQLAKRHNFGSVIVFMDNKDDYIDGFAFSSNSNNNIASDYFKHWQQIGYFRNYFLNASQNLIKNSKQTRIILPKKDITIIENEKNMFDTEKLSSLFKASHYYLTANNKEYKLTARQFECLKYLAQGRKIKEIAQIMGISPRTVEEHQQNIEDIFGVNHRREIIDIYLASNLIGL